MPWTLLTWGPTKNCSWHTLTLDKRLGRTNAHRGELIAGRVFLTTRRCYGPFAFTYQRELKSKA